MTLALATIEFILELEWRARATTLPRERGGGRISARDANSDQSLDMYSREREREGNERPKQMIYRACFGYHLGQLEKFTRFGHGSFRFFLSPSTKDKMANERCKRVR